MESTGRTLAVCDIENLTGVDPRTVTSGHLRSTLRAFREGAGLGSNDLEVIASNPALALEVHHAAPHARLRCRRGPDGADLTLLEELGNPSWLASRFDRVVVGSGDGIFTEAVIALNRTEVTTVVVARPRGLSRRLRLAAQQVIPLGAVDPLALAA